MSRAAQAVRSAWWARSPRERCALAIGALFLATFFGYALLWQPLASALARSESELRAAQARLALARQRADEIAMLARERRDRPAEDLRTATRRVLAAHAGSDSVTALDVQDARVRITFASITVDRLAALITALGREERLFPVEIALLARVEPGTVRADVTLAR